VRVSPNRAPPFGFGSACTVATEVPRGVVSTMLPSSPFAVTMSPFGASVIPSGPFSGMPVNTVRRPPVAGKKRNGASGIVSS
jgi:hypothetical protein